jgi:aryl-alcohol dehydrogenase-like predicted oxidoreductase
MGFSRTIPGTDLHVSAIGLGTVKLGRDQGVKYPDAFTIPDDAAVTRLLDQARDSGINLLDTASAYGNSEQRLGKLLANRQDWIIATKTGEEFENGVSRFDFSA